MAATVLVQAPAGTGSINAAQTGAVYTPDANGQFLCDPLDIRFLVLNGFRICGNKTYWYSIVPAAANVNAQFSSAALSNGTMAIAAQPDCMRPVKFIAFATSPAITAGLLTLTYTANDGSTIVDTFSLVCALNSSINGTTSRGVSRMTSQIVTGLVGGGSPTIQIGTTASIAVPTNLGAEGITFIKEAANTGNNTAMADEAIGTVVGTYGVITPTTAPAASKTLSFGYTFTSP